MSFTETKRRTRNYGFRRSAQRNRVRVKSTKKWEPWSAPTYQSVPDVKGTQITVSEPHTWPPPRGGFQGDVGGNFFTTKQEASISHGGSLTEVKDTPAGFFDITEYISDNPYCPFPTVGNNAKWPTSLHSSDDDLADMGATAVAQCSPTNASSDLLTAIGELFKDGLPASESHRNWQKRAQTAKSAGSEYLNAQFGWLPLVSDISAFADTVLNADRILSQYERDMGKLVRRRRELPSTQERSETVLSNSQYPLGIQGPISGAREPLAPGRWIETTWKTYSRWFSGAFSYGIPLNSTSRAGMSSLAQKADKLFGISLTPDVLWELAPWSWAIDWFSNTGDVLSNLSDVASQGLVMQYGYMMETTIHRKTYSLIPAGNPGRFFSVPPVTLSTVTKKRVKANPFGFGVSWDGLSPLQLSIAAALGISRS